MKRILIANMQQNADKQIVAAFNSLGYQVRIINDCIDAGSDWLKMPVEIFCGDPQNASVIERAVKGCNYLLILGNAPLATEKILPANPGLSSAIKSLQAIVFVNSGNTNASKADGPNNTCKRDNSRPRIIYVQACMDAGFDSTQNVGYDAGYLSEAMESILLFGRNGAIYNIEQQMPAVQVNAISSFKNWAGSKINQAFHFIKFGYGATALLYEIFL